MDSKAYVYGVILGDGFFGYRGKKDDSQLPDYLMLKACDFDFVEKFRCEVERLTSKKYSIYKVSKGNKKRNALYLCKCYAQEIAKEAFEITRGKEVIPDFIVNGSRETQISFLQGLMDSEGYITCSFNSIKQSHIGLHFACTSSWTKSIWHMFQDLGVGVSKLYTRRFKDGRRPVLYFKINIEQYIKCGLGFNIQRKQRRLDFISKILRDYTHTYKKSYHDCVQDIVRPLAKACG